MVLTQSLADIDLIYGRDERMAMLNNFAYKIVLGCSDSDTQEYFSRLIGEKEVYRKAVSKNGKQVTNTRTEAKRENCATCGVGTTWAGHIDTIGRVENITNLRRNYYFELESYGIELRNVLIICQGYDEEDFSDEKYSRP